MSNNKLSQIQEAVEKDSPEPWRNIIKDLLIAYKIPISLTVIVTAAYFIFTVFSSISVPSWFVNSLPYVAILIPVGAIFGRLILKAFLQEDVNLLLVIDLQTQDDRINLWNLGDEKRKRLTVTGGGLWGDGPIKVCESYDPAENVAEGVWISKLSPIELLKYRHALRDAKTELRREAAEGIAAGESAKTAIFASLRTNLQMALKQLLLSGNELTGEQINDEIERISKQAALETIEDTIADDEFEERFDSAESLIEEENPVATDGGEQNNE